jgi:hypothetical protein
MNSVYLLKSYQCLVTMSDEWQAFLEANMFVNRSFSEVEVIKSKCTNRLDDERRESCPQVATSHVRPKIGNLVAKI